MSATCYEYFQAQQQGSDCDDSQYDTESIQNWPTHFNIESVPHVEEAELKEKPVIQHGKSESIGNFFKNTNIRQCVEVKLAERRGSAQEDDNISQASIQLS